MTDDEFRDKFHDLLKEYDPDKKKDFLLTLISFEEDNVTPDDIYMLGRGCPVCIVVTLQMQVEDGSLKHTDPNRDHKVH